jgi:LysW-gamma-L-lysine carboxypeptidase
MSELLQELVSHYSPSYHEAAAVSHLVEWMKKQGYEAAIDEVGNARGVRGPESAPRTLMLLGHIDTVPGEIPVRVERGRLYGRGSVDAKGSLCCFAEATAQAVIPEGWRVVVAGAVEEEVTSSKGARHIMKRFNPDLCLIGEPSGSERITLGYKGRLLIDYSYERTMSHTARPEPSAGAIGVMFWQGILAWVDQQNAGMGIDDYFQQVMPNLRSINTESDGFHERVKMTIGFRLPPHVPPAKVVAAASSLAAPNSELRSYGAEVAYRGDKNGAASRGMLAAIRAMGKRPGFVWKTGTSDMNIVGAEWTCPMVAYGPGDSRLDHTPNEHIPLAEYEAAVKTLVYFIEHLNDLNLTASAPEAN